MDLDVIPAQVAAMTAYLTGKFPRPRSERGQNTLENAFLIAAVVVVVGIVITAITAAVNKHVAGIK